jgi:NTP pyrophosphatase (non-canonical NTP hydrolase)
MRIITSNQTPEEAALFMNVLKTAPSMREMEAWMNSFCHLSHGCSRHAGWWDGERIFGELVALVHSEISEAMEGGRKDKMDDHLPDRTAVAAELADAVIRIGDLAGALNIPLGTVIVEKMRYNAQREDHKRENRAKEGGKQF